MVIFFLWLHLYWIYKWIFLFYRYGTCIVTYFTWIIFSKIIAKHHYFFIYQYNIHVGMVFIFTVFFLCKIYIFIVILIIILYSLIYISNVRIFYLYSIGTLIIIFSNFIDTAFKKSFSESHRCRIQTSSLKRLTCTMIIVLNHIMQL